MSSEPDPNWPEFTVVAESDVWIERGTGEIYVKQSAIDNLFADDGLYCFRITGYPIAGL
jgi:hypothetical protein